jgi:hypothetical protein
MPTIRNISDRIILKESHIITEVVEQKECELQSQKFLDLNLPWDTYQTSGLRKIIEALKYSE